MTECDDIFHHINKKAEIHFQRIPEECERTLEWLKNYREEIQKKIKQFKQVQNETYSVPILPKTPSRHKRPKRLARSSTSSDEDNTSNKTNNQSSDITISSINSSKPKRNACLLAEKKINIQSQVKLNSKLRRPGKDNNALNDISNNTDVLAIKSEKVSASPLKEPVPPVEVKQETETLKKENMPPPAAKPKRVRKKVKKEIDSSDTENESSTRVTRSKRGVHQSSTSDKSKKEKGTRRNNRPDSDVIIQEVPIPLVIIDSEEDFKSQTETENNKDSKKIEETPTQTDDEPANGKKKIKKKVEKKTKKTEEKKYVLETKDDTLYEDALPVVSKDVQPSKNVLNMMNCVVNLENMALNGTHIIEKELNVTHVKSPALNQTRVLPKDTNAIIKTPNGAQNCTVVLHKLDETITLPKSNTIANQTVVLTPKENNSQWQKPDILPINDIILTDDESIVKETPEKKKDPSRKGVKTKQMFSPYANSPVRKRVAAFEKLVQNDPEQPTRVTRTKTRNLEKDKDNQTSTESVKPPVKSKYFTPITNNKLPSLIPHSDSKISRPGIILPAKSSTAIKLSRTELQQRREEEQKKRLEKEQEAKRKREAIMQAKAEEQRKKREEKQLKAQKAREEMEREKDEKLRQMLQEKEDEQQKKREWQMKKLAEIEERKRLEAEQQKLLQKMREQDKQRQIEEKKKKQKAQLPPLPTGDWEDSESESDQPVTRKPRYQKPDWALDKSLYRTLLMQNIVSKTCIIKDWFHMVATTPDLQEIFENIDERYLRRNSSAVWRTPPRYSRLPKY